LALSREKEMKPRRKRAKREAPTLSRAAQADERKRFRDEDTDPIGIDEFKSLHLEDMPEDLQVWIMDNYFPDMRVWRDGEFLVCEIEEHLYTKYWEHKFSAYAFAGAMGRAVQRRPASADPMEHR
jgi:hypothetical protein